MSRRLTLGGIFLFTCLSYASAQDPAILPAVSLPPVQGELPVLNSGTAVSRPLQPVTIPEQPKPILKDPTVNAVTPEANGTQSPNGLPSSWSRYDLLFWFPKAQPLPPLLTASPSFASPVLGGPLTAVFVGNHAIDTPTSLGGRFTWGWSLGADSNVGIEATYLFTGGRSATAMIDGRSQNLSYGRPLIDPQTGKEYVLSISTPSNRGGFLADTQNRMAGWEVNGVANMARSEFGYINALAGYRYFGNNEGVRLEQLTNLSPNSYVNSADQFDGHTHFHGGQIGLEGSLNGDRFFIGMIGKIAFGASYETVNISGQTNIITPTGGTAIPSGVMAVGSNSGRQNYTAFAVLPEGQLNLGYRFRDHSKFFIGYSVMYLSDAVRPGDQIDRTVSTMFNTQAANTFMRPEPMFKRTDFWVQGITLGFDYKY